MNALVCSIDYLPSTPVFINIGKWKRPYTFESRLRGLLDEKGIKFIAPMLACLRQFMKLCLVDWVALQKLKY